MIGWVLAGWGFIVLVVIPFIGYRGRPR